MPKNNLQPTRFPDARRLRLYGVAAGRFLCFLRKLIVTSDVLIHFISCISFLSRYQIFLDSRGHLSRKFGFFSLSAEMLEVLTSFQIFYRKIRYGQSVKPRVSIARCFEISASILYSRREKSQF